MGRTYQLPEEVMQNLCLEEKEEQVEEQVEDYTIQTKVNMEGKVEKQPILRTLEKMEAMAPIQLDLGLSLKELALEEKVGQEKKMLMLDMAEMQVPEAMVVMVETAEMEELAEIKHMVEREAPEEEEDMVEMVETEAPEEKVEL